MSRNECLLELGRERMIAVCKRFLMCADKFSRLDEMQSASSPVNPTRSGSILSTGFGSALRKQMRVCLSVFAMLGVGVFESAYAESTFFPIDTFGVAGPIPTPANISDLEGPPTAGVSVTFDPGDLGFILFDEDISGATTPLPNAGLIFNIISSVPSASGDTFVSFLLGNIADDGAGLAFTIAPTGSFVAPDGSDSIFQFTQLPGAGLFTLSTDAFVPACNTIGGCNTIVLGTSGLGAAGGSSFTDGGTLSFASVVASSPEPASWALMILGFLGVARQMKTHRRRVLATPKRAETFASSPKEFALAS